MLLGISLIFITILGGIITYWSFSVAEKKQEIQKIINEYNTLYECSGCNKYHRKYQQIIKEKSDETYRKVQSGWYYIENGDLKRIDQERLFSWDNNENVCPHCYKTYSHKVQEVYDWTNFHQDCIALNANSFKSVAQTLDELDRLAYEERSVKTFIEKNNLLKQN